MTTDYISKYLKYKNKYLELKNKLEGGTKCFKYGIQQHHGECWHDALTMLLFQSDVTNGNDELINNLNEIHINDQYYKFRDVLFTERNLDKNAYKLPELIYSYYLSNKTKEDTHKKIMEFLDLSKKYMLDQQQRISNRLKSDLPHINKYHEKDYKYNTTFREGLKFFKEEFITNVTNDFNIFYDFVLEQENFPDREEILKKNVLSDIEKKEYVKAPEYKKYMENFYKYLSTLEGKTILSEKFRKIYDKSQSELEKPKSEKLYRRLSFTKSIQCSMNILKISRIFYNTTEPTRLVHGGNKLHEIFAMQIINLYLDDKYYYTYYYLNISHIQYFKKEILELLDSELLIGINLNMAFYNNKSRHAISLYTCNKTQILYDDNLAYPIETKWKEAIKNFSLTQNKIYNHKHKIHKEDENKNLNYYFTMIRDKFFTQKYNKNLNYIGIPQVLEKIPLDKIDDYEEKKTYVLGTQLINSDYFKENIAYIDEFIFVSKKNREVTEENHLIYMLSNRNLNTIFIEYKDFDIMINRLLEIMKINKSDPDALISFIEYLFNKNNNVAIYVIRYLNEMISKLYTPSHIIGAKLQIKLITEFKHLLLSSSFGAEINITMGTLLYVLYLNTPESEYFLNILSDIFGYINVVNNFKKWIINIEKTDKSYSWDGEKNVIKSLKEIINEHKLDNKTDSIFKQELIDIIESLKV